MSLRRQLLLVSLILLCLPWAGCQFVREMEGALRQGQAQALMASATAIAQGLGQRPALLYPEPARLGASDSDDGALYAPRIDHPLIVDGYKDGWRAETFARFRANAPAALSVGYRAAVRGESLYLFLEVEDPVLTYYHPGLPDFPNGDHLILLTEVAGQTQHYAISTAAPGQVHAQLLGRSIGDNTTRRIHGVWQETERGYNVELVAPLSLLNGRLGFYVVSHDRGQRVTAGNFPAGAQRPPPWLITAPPALAATVAPLAEGLGELRVLDRTGADLATSGELRDAAHANGETFWLLRLLYRQILRGDNPTTATPEERRVGYPTGDEINAALSGERASHWYRSQTSGSRNTLSVAVPIRHEGSVAGALVLRQDSERYLSLTDNAFTRLAVLSLLTMAVVALGLLGFASVLSWRIRRLSRAAGQVLEKDGRLRDNFPRSKARDEIGDLSRGYDDLLTQLREYQDYLKSLSHKLSHELRTPIAVIRSSLDNLEHAGDDAPTYIGRARDGLGRLNDILTAMSEANRLEESLAGSERQQTDLVALLGEVFPAYRSLYTQHQLSLHCPDGVAMAWVAPELIIQALDKLLDNAASFTPTGGAIQIELSEGPDHWQLSVCNEGPALPLDMQSELFNSMVSRREAGSDRTHLGLGLHIVRLIAEFHGGRALAENLPTGAGVRCTIALPRALNNS